MALSAIELGVLLSVEQFMELPDSEGKLELVRGEVREMTPSGGAHGRAATNLVLLLGPHVKIAKLGTVFADNTCYELIQLPRTVRAPDASFVRAGRLPPDGVGLGPLQLTPDLAIEVLSPSESASELQEKLDDYVTCGTSLIWVVDPIRRTVTAISNGGPVRFLQETDTLTGDDVVAGFSCAVLEIFEGIARDLAPPRRRTPAM